MGGRPVFDDDRIWMDGRLGPGPPTRIQRRLDSMDDGVGAVGPGRGRAKLRTIQTGFRWISPPTFRVPVPNVKLRRTVTVTPGCLSSLDWSNPFWRRAVSWVALTTLIWTVHTKQAKSETRRGTRKITGSRKPTEKNRAGKHRLTSQDPQPG